MSFNTLARIRAARRNPVRMAGALAGTEIACERWRDEARLTAAYYDAETFVVEILIKALGDHPLLKRGRDGMKPIEDLWNNAFLFAAQKRGVSDPQRYLVRPPHDLETKRKH